VILGSVFEAGSPTGVLFGLFFLWSRKAIVVIVVPAAVDAMSAVGSV
jgi:hypothetical protein